ncbi:MAG: AI-2E family transporter [Alphaproteobacteria bacterium]|nr:AI-2E family transporter [Alphaproteobacteria bacterium]
MQTRNRFLILLTILIFVGGLIYLIRSVLAPFICSLVIAYFLDPLVYHLTSKHGLSRLKATSLIIGLFFAIFISVGAILIPVIYIQLVDLIESLPHYIKTIAHNFYPKIISMLELLGLKPDGDFIHLIGNEKTNSYLIDWSRNFIGNTLTSSLTLINILSLVFITPILIFYLLKDWDIFMHRIYELLPESISTTAKELASEINKTLSGYVRGQLNVCFIMAIFYSASLSIAGLNFGFLIGFLTGIFSFIPYVGMLSGTSVAVVVALFQWGLDITNLSIIGVIFVVAQIIESNFLTPQLIGNRIGLHPVWVIFGLFFFGVLFGFLGVLLAVPLSAICGVVTKYFVRKYWKEFI